ncbi:M16 family metallopeptidase [Vibrio furnissii]|uniref:M16 family metallopeptidase n=1 Tax=Vibrio furnissii TaxID=29494 RepID=UPI00399B083D
MIYRYLAGIFALLLVGCAAQPTSTPFKPSQAWVSQTLDNGLTYHLYPDQNEAVSIRLYVHAGSFQETLRQAGYAHYVEHMAFNGSVHYEHNAVIDMVAKSGGQFGADLNAYTNYSQTVYQLDLPDNQHMDDALLWMRDIADGLTFDPQEVEKEKGVILGEFRFRRSEPDMLYEHFTEGTDYLTYDPLGNRSNVQMATADGLREFYQTWYQPQLTEVIITGNITLEQGEQWVRQYFSDWQKGTTPRPARPALSQQNTSDLIYTASPGDSPRLSLFYPQGEIRIADHEALLNYRLNEIATRLMEHRLQNAFYNAALPTQDLAAFSYNTDDLRYTELTIAFPVEQRAASQSLFLNTLASLRDHGTTPQELEMVLQSYRDDLENFDWYRSQLTSNTLADDRVYAISYDEVLPSDLEYNKALKALLSAATLTRVNQHLNAFLQVDPMIELVAAESEDLNALQRSTDHLRHTLKQPGISQRISQVETPFLPPAAPGDILRSQSFDDQPELTQWTLSNGVEVYYLRSEHAGDDVYLHYGSIGGAVALPRALYPAGQLAVNVASRSGLGQLSNVQLNNYLKEKNIYFAPYIDLTSHGVMMRANQKNMEALFALLNQMTRDIRVDDNQLASIQSETVQAIDEGQASSDGQLGHAINHATYLEDSVHWLFDKADYQQVTRDQIYQVHHELFQKQRNNTLVIVANTSPLGLQALLRQYVANLAFDKGNTPDFQVAYRQPIQPRIELPVNTKPNTQYYIRIVAPISTPDAKTVFMDDLLTRIANHRLTAVVREHQSLDYSPFALALNMDSERSVDWMLGAVVEPEDAQKVEAAFDEVVSSMATSISTEETQVVAKQLLTDLNNMKKNASSMAWYINRYVIHHFGLEAALNMEATLRSISTDDLTQRARQIFGESSMKQKILMTPMPETH